MRVTPRAALVGATVVVAATVLAGCTSSSGKRSIPDPRHSSSPSGAASTSYTPPKPATGVSIASAVVHLDGKNATMSGTIVNRSDTAYRVTAITCACAGKVQSGTPGPHGTLVPVVGGSPLPAHGTLAFGTSRLQVRLSGVFASAKSGTSVPVIAYVRTGASIKGTATVA